MCYSIVVEKADNNFSAYVPDLPGCVATGHSREAVQIQVREPIKFHLEGCVNMAFPYHRRPVTLAMLRSRPNTIHLTVIPSVVPYISRGLNRL